MRKAIIHLKEKDAILRRIIEKVGPCRIEYREPAFSTLVRSIVYQQLSGRVARVIYDRLLDAAANGSELTPEAILKLRPAKLRAKDRTLDDPLVIAGGPGAQNPEVLAPFVDVFIIGDGEESLPWLMDRWMTLKENARRPGGVSSLRDRADLIAELVAVKGVGRWTAEMFLIFRLGRADVLPVHDLGVRKGYQIAYGKRKLPEPESLERFGAKWKPHRTAAAWYLWRSLDNEAAL